MPGQIEINDILNKFQQVKLLSADGGQKVVFTVNLPEHGQSILKIGLYGSETSLKRIQREVEILQEIDSPYFPRNYGFSVVDANRYFILEEYLEGGTLDAHISKYSQEWNALTLINELITGLRILWDRRVVHRDLKPQNIIIGKDHPKIIDLGIARVLDSTSLTQTFAPYGPRTPAYASPEQIENRKKDIDFRSDQFNLGIILAQLILAGEHPFSPDAVGNAQSIVENLMEGKWARDKVSRMVSPSTFAVISRCLKYQPYERYRKADDLHQAVLNILGG